MIRNLSKKADMGMGTLIIFIALILVAAIAAAVLISTTSSLQNQALTTGAATTQEVGTSLSVIEIVGEDGSDGNVEGLGTLVRLSAGSDSVRFQDTLVSLSIDDMSQDYQYNQTFNCSNLSNVSGTTYDNNTGEVTGNEPVQYGVDYSIKGQNWRDNYLVSGDVAQVCFNTPRVIEEGENFRLSIVPRIGTTANVEAALPSLILSKRPKLFP